jgi:hypothetical protein
MHPTNPARLPSGTQKNHLAPNTHRDPFEAGHRPAKKPTDPSIDHVKRKTQNLGTRWPSGRIPRTPGAGQTSKLHPTNPARLPSSTQNGLRIGLPGQVWLIYAAFLKPGPLVRVPGPSLAGNRHKTNQNRPTKPARLPSGTPKMLAPFIAAPHKAHTLLKQWGWAHEPANAASSTGGLLHPHGSAGKAPQRRATCRRRRSR